MKRKSIAQVFGGFARHYGEEVGAVATAINMIVDVLPVQAQDKANVKLHVDKIAKAATNIERALDETQMTGISQDDIARAVAAYLADDDTFAAAVDKAVGAKLDAAVAERLDDLVREKVDAFLLEREQGNRADHGDDLRKSADTAGLRENEGTTVREQQEGDAPGTTKGNTSAKPGSKPATGQRAPEKSNG